MNLLTPAECRVLGVLVEKAHTSSAYPLSLNAATDGCNQKTNRDPVVNYDEQTVLTALEGLQAKHLVIFADSQGSRVTKFRHNARETLALDEPELLLLTELLLRGPQSAAELRLHASRMRPLPSLDIVQSALSSLLARPTPLIQRLPGGRAERFYQLLCPSLHPLSLPESPSLPGSVYLPVSASPCPRVSASSPPASSPSDQTDRLGALETEVARLRGIVERLANALGASDILKEPDGQ